MNKEDFFLNTIEELREKIESGDKYHLIKAAGIMRQLIADSTPLINKLNVEQKLKIQFEIADSGELRSEPGLFQMVDLEPSSTFNTKTVSLDKFLKRDIISWNNEKYNILDFIKIAANTRGGVHLGEYKSQKEQNLEYIINSGLAFSFNQNGAVDPNLAVLIPIYNVLLKGIMPLIEKLKAGK